MSKLFRSGLFMLALWALALSAVAHVNAPYHDSAECTFCLYQPNTDLQSSANELIIAEFTSISERFAIRSVPFYVAQRISPFFGRAPPFFT